MHISYRCGPSCPSDDGIMCWCLSLHVFYANERDIWPNDWNRDYRPIEKKGYQYNESE